ncbi:MAG: MerR family transcriptional regulator [Chloroflexi bacterium]|nr:MAG: MerR family transcriptional regulator [Chloroflexota bacterium]
MGQHYYHTGQFAQKASVSIRTLRYYDKVGLLSPSQYTEAGYRLYNDTDFLSIQQSTGPTILQESLALQKAMMQEKRIQLDTIIQAIDETAELLQANKQDWESIVRVIQVIQMQPTNDWRKKYFTEEQLNQMEQLSNKYYSEEQRAKLAEWGKDWTEEDQLAANQQWGEAIAELKLLVSTAQDPASPEAQALVQKWQNLVHQFTHGDTGIQQGLRNMYKDVSQAPAEQVPYPLPYNQEEEAFLQKAIKIYQQNHSEK